MNRSKIFILLSPMLLLSSMLFAAREAGVSADVFTITDFSKTLDSKWHSKSLKGNTRYERVRFEQGTWALKATARDTASLIIRRLKIEPDEFPILRWRWKIEELPKNGNEAKPEGDDAAARILLVFKDGSLPWKVKSICYIWANKLPKGTSADNVFSSKVKMVAVRSGTSEIRMWKTEERNYVRDYERFFGKKPKQLIGVAIMTDTDNTGSEAIAYYDFIELGASGRTI